MKLKKVLVLLALTGVVVVAAAQGMGGYGHDQMAASAAPFGLVLKAWNASSSMMDSVVSGNVSEQGSMVLAGLALLATIVRRSFRNNG